MDKGTTMIITYGYTELLIPKNVLPLQIRLKHDSFEYHIKTKEPDLDKLNILLSNWFVGLKLLKICEVN